MVSSCFGVQKFEIDCKNHTKSEVSERSKEYELGTSSGRIWRTFLQYVWLTVQIESVSSLVSTESLAFIMDWDEAGFSIQMYHNGEIRGNYYVNGSVDWFDYCDKDRMLMTEIDAMVKELGHEGFINYWYSIPGGSFDGGLVKLSEDTYVLDMLVFVPDTRVINIFLEHVLACSQEQFYSQVGSNIFINLDDDFGTNTGVVLQELDDNYGSIVPVGGGVEGFNQEAGGEGKELNEEGLNEDGLIDEASKQGKETATMNNEENSDKGQEKPSQGCSDKGKDKDKEMSHRVKRAFGKK
ncbi:unnamed protein product, partial [Prunus brigantina]